MAILMGKKAAKRSGIFIGGSKFRSDGKFSMKKFSLVMEFEPSDKVKRAMKKKRVRDYYFPTNKGKSNV